MLKSFIIKILERYGFYRIENLQVGSHCGCCGTWIEKDIVLKDWSWGLCEECLKP